MTNQAPPPPRPKRNPYRIRDPRVWALVRPRYLAGESAPALAEVFGLTEYAIRRRITREGWSKRALAEAEAAGLPEPGTAAAAVFGRIEADEGPAWTDEAGEPGPRAAARAALEAAARLMRNGRMSAAAEAARVADVMARAAARLEGDGPIEAEEPDEAAFEAVRRKVLGLGVPPPQREER